MLHRIAEKIRRGEVVLWTGAGFNWDAGLPMGNDLVNAIKQRCAPEEVEFLDQRSGLPEVAEEYVRLRRGDRSELIRIVQESLDRPTPDLVLHRLVKGMVQIETIITTNYDNLFERAFEDQLVVLSTDKDLANYGRDDRTTLIKVHGDICRDPDGIIITRSDYNRFLDNSVARNSLLWSCVKTCLAHKSVVLVGHGFDDPNVEFVFEAVSKQLSDSVPERFLIAPSWAQHNRDRLEQLGIHYVDMTAREALECLHKMTYPYTVIGFKDGEYTKISRIAQVVRENGIELSLTASTDGSRSITLVPGTPMTLDMQFTSQAHKALEAFHEGRELKLKIPSKMVLSMETKTGDFLLDQAKGGISGDLVFQRHPTRQYSGVLVIKSMPEKVMADVCCYELSHEYQVSLNSQCLAITIRTPKLNRSTHKLAVTFKYGSDIEEMYAAAMIASQFACGKTLMVIDPERNHKVPLAGNFTGADVDSFRDRMHQYLTHLRRVRSVATHFNLCLDMSKWSAGDDSAVATLISAIHRGKRDVQTVAYSWPAKELEPHLDRLESLVFEHHGEYEPLTVILCGNEVTIQRKLVFTDAVMQNTDEVRKALLEDQEQVNITLRSPSCSIYDKYRCID